MEEEPPDGLLDESTVTVYDAVAGRVDYESFFSTPEPSKHGDTTSNTFTPIPPDEVLARLEDAPSRDEETDIYSADRHLDQTKELLQLPDSDLLKALHAYSSDFYARAAADGGEDDWGSLDETALLALGILVEEAAGQFRSGDEGDSSDEEGSLSDEEGDVKSETDVKSEPNEEGENRGVLSSLH
jgi:hypothetical protein